MPLLVVGSVAYDGIKTPGGEVDRVLGGAGSYISLAACHFTEVRLVAVVGDDFSHDDEAVLRRHNIDLEGLERSSGMTFYWKGEYSRRMNQRRTIVTELGVFADFHPQLPEPYRATPHILLGNIHPDLQNLVLDQAPHRSFAAGDTMNYWIERTPDQLASTVRRWDSILINDEEALQLTRLDNLVAAARAILAMGPSTVVIKRGEHGATLFRAGECFIAPAYPLEHLIDPTGAGDAFAGGFMGYLASQGYRHTGEARSDDLRKAVIYGSVMGSFCCERFGVGGLTGLTRDEIDGRFEEFRDLTSYRLRTMC